MTVIDLAKYMRAREIASRPQATAPIWIGDHTSQSKDRDEHVIGTDWGAVPDEGGTLSARVLQKLDRNAQLSKFFELAANATGHINECIDLLEQQDNLAADDQFMAGKQIFAELLMFRDISDSVGLVLLRVGLIINAHVFRPLRDAEKVHECWQGGPTPRRSRLFSRNPWRAVGIG